MNVPIATWRHLLTVLGIAPAEFADGVDNTGGTPSDLICTSCVQTTELADTAVPGHAVR
jgi:hypothetical protein